MRDFFISYNSADRSWADWIAWVLEEQGYRVIIQVWDFRPGGNFVLDMQRATAEAERTVMVLSDALPSGALHSAGMGAMLQLSQLREKGLASPLTLTQRQAFKIKPFIDCKDFANCGAG